MANKDDVVFKLTIHCLTLKGKRYGAAPVSVSIGGTSPGSVLFAVVCDKEKWCSIREDCERWLTQHGLTESEDTLVIDDGKLLNENKAHQDKNDLADQEEPA